jgi:hypothetical protein
VTYQLSSGETFFIKFLLPPCFIGSTGFLTLGAFAGWLKRADGTPESPIFGFITLPMLVLGGCWLLYLALKLKAVSLHGDHVCISSYFRKELILLAEIESVKEWPWLIIVRFNHDTHFGRSIWFMPKRGLMHFFPEPVADELRAAVAAVRQSPKRTAISH